LNTHIVDYEKMPGHRLLASLGKTVLRPGGIQMTRQMLEHLAITEQDHVVEFTPGLGHYGQNNTKKKPTYTAIERDEEAAKSVKKTFAERS